MRREIAQAVKDIYQSISLDEAKRRMKEIVVVTKKRRRNFVISWRRILKKG
jgi:hypothetical protein